MIRAEDFTHSVSRRAPSRWTIAGVAAALIVVNILGGSSAAAQEQIMFPAVQDAQAVLLQKIRNERVRVDVGIWILGDGEIVQTLINKFTIEKVPVRVLGDRAIIFETDPDTRRSFELLATAGVPIRLRYNPTWYPEILHWKAMIFAGQGLVEFGSANYTGYELKPWSATDFKDESVMFTDDPAIVNAFRTMFDRYWVDTDYFKDWQDAYLLETGITWTAPMTIPRGRQEPDYPTTIPGMIWGQGPDLNSAIVAEIDRETRGVDMMFYRLTIPDITDALIRKHQSGVPVQVFAEPTQYRNDTWPEFWLVGAVVDRLIAAGIPVKQRLHQGLTHIKALITSNIALNASSNFARGWERDHNYFISASSKPLLHSAYRQRFEQMWGDAVNYGPFRQQPAFPATLVSPARGMLRVPRRARLEWKRAPFATSFDVYLGTSQDNMRPTRVNAQIDENPPDTYTFTPAPALLPATTYYWRVVSRTYGTDANPSLVASSEIWAFRTEPSSDFDGDGMTDLAVFRPSLGEWYVRKSSSGYGFGDYLSYQWGRPGDIPMAADFDGDGRIDLTVFRPSTTEWYIRYSSRGYDYNFDVYQWGLIGDIPVVADFDGDARSDLAVYRPSSGEWYVRLSSTNYSYAFLIYQWGLADDQPIPSDFDGDGRSDLAVYRPTTGEWFIRYSSRGYSYAFDVFQWGLPGDVPVTADFDGDGRTDLVVFRPQEGNWYVRRSSSNYSYADWLLYPWGLPGDVPLAADFDGDRRTDLCVFRPATAEWYVLYSSTGYSYGNYRVYQWGLSRDMALVPNKP